MPTTANINPTAESDGLLYANAVPLTAQEADLNGGTGAVPTPIPVEAGQAIVAVVQLTVQGYIIAPNNYVVMQTDMGDGTWVDINWCVTTINQGTATFVFSNGVAGADTFQQNRQAGAFPSPQANGLNQQALGGRVRFVGKSTSTGGSSNVLGTASQVIATIRYKLLHLR